MLSHGCDSISIIFLRVNVYVSFLSDAPARRASAAGQCAAPCIRLQCAVAPMWWWLLQQKCNAPNNARRWRLVRCTTIPNGTEFSVSLPGHAPAMPPCCILCTTRSPLAQIKSFRSHLPCFLDPPLLFLFLLLPPPYVRDSCSFSLVSPLSTK